MAVWYQNRPRKRQQHLPQRSQRTQSRKKNSNGEETARKRKRIEHSLPFFLDLPSSSRFLRRLNSYLCDLCVLCGECCFFAVFSHFARFFAHFFSWRLFFGWAAGKV